MDARIPESRVNTVCSLNLWREVFFFKKSFNNFNNWDYENNDYAVAIAEFALSQRSSSQ